MSSIPFARRPAAEPAPGAVEHMVRMRDGVRLATDVYSPDGGDAPGPTILTRLPYDKRSRSTYLPAVAAYFARHGFRHVVQDVRGKFRSEGETVPWINEVYDGYDTIEWIVNQPWSDGIVGMWGTSYFGFTQLAAASAAHPALRAIVPRMTGRYLGDLPMRGEGERTTDAEMHLVRLYAVSHFQANDTFEWEMEWKRPYAEVIERWFESVGERSPAFDLWSPNPVKLRRFPAGDPFDAPAVPILQTIGWWDNCAPWQWPDHEQIKSRPAWAANEYLLLEPIDHKSYRHTGAPYGPEDDHAVDDGALERLLPRTLDSAVEFFDVFLRGNGSPDEIPRVRWWAVGEDAFRSSETWPPPGAATVEMSLGHGTLAEERDSDSTTKKWVHDPDDPVPSPATNSFVFLKDFPDEAYLAERADVLTFTSEPRIEPTILAGPIELVAEVRSSASEADFFARLADLAPDGSAHMVARGQLTLHEATSPCRIVIPLGHAGYVVEPGHSLRLTLASSDAPDYVTSPGTGENRWLAVETSLAEQEIRLGGEAGALLRLTVLQEQ